MKKLLLLILVLTSCTHKHRFEVGECYLERTENYGSVRQILKVGKEGYGVGLIGSTKILGELPFEFEYSPSVLKIDCDFVNQ